MAGTAFLVTLKTVTMCTAFAMRLSPIPDIHRVCKFKTTENVSALPLISLWGTNYLWLLYGYLDTNIFPVATTSVFGCLVALGYIAVYFRWSSERRYVAKLFGLVLLGLLAATIYAVLGVLGTTHQTRDEVRDIVGFISAAVSVVLHDLFMLTPNAIGVALSAVQIALYAVFNPKRQTDPEEVDHELGLCGSSGDLMAPDSTCSKDGSHASLILSPKDDISPFPFVKSMPG
ncbi:hypothetical protein PybrP1_009158 [[Pythium] brassicae (nom. inval.)]|nr:hypothetical protein PybrP1_009158 [[Pythium] brassicae (nom. inval.)]